MATGDLRVFLSSRSLSLRPFLPPSRPSTVPDSDFVALHILLPTSATHALLSRPLSTSHGHRPLCLPHGHDTHTLAPAVPHICSIRPFVWILWLFVWISEWILFFFFQELVHYFYFSVRFSSLFPFISFRFISFCPASSVPSPRYPTQLPPYLSMFLVRPRRVCFLPSPFLIDCQCPMFTFVRVTSPSPLRRPSPHLSVKHIRRSSSAPYHRFFAPPFFVFRLSPFDSVKLLISFACSS